MHEVAGKRVDRELRPVAAGARAVELIEGDRFERGADRAGGVDELGADGRRVLLAVPIGDRSLVLVPVGEAGSVLSSISARRVSYSRKTSRT